MRSFVLCARCNDSHEVLGVYPSWGRAQAMADVGNRLEVAEVTARYIELARAATTDEERDHWAREMLQVRNDGVVRWFLYVQETRGHS